jgi:hypothetical protein
MIFIFILIIVKSRCVFTADAAATAKAGSMHIIFIVFILYFCIPRLPIDLSIYQFILLLLISSKFQFVYVAVYIISKLQCTFVFIYVLNLNHSVV